MNTSLIALPFVALLLFALMKERREAVDAYIDATPKDSDTFAKLQSRVLVALGYESRSVKWRSCILLATLITIALFTIVYVRVPTPREVVLTILVIYVCAFLGWESYVSRVGKPASELGRKCVVALQRKRRVIDLP